MPHVLPILADSTEEFIKFLFGGLFFLIWVVGAIVSANKKRQNDARRLQQQQEAWNQARPAPAYPSPHPSSQPPALPNASQQSWQDIYRDLTGAVGSGSRPSTPPPLPPQPPANRRKDRRGPRRKSAQAAPAVPSQAVPPLAEEAGNAIITSAARITEPPTRGTSSAARLVPRLTANSLRQQFILTEILRPPLALREDEEPAGH